MSQSSTNQISDSKVEQHADQDFEFLGKLVHDDSIFDNPENVKPEPKRRSIKFKCKSVEKKPTRRSTRYNVHKNYQEEEVPDDDHYICKLRELLF